MHDISGPPWNLVFVAILPCHRLFFDFMLNALKCSRRSDENVILDYTRGLVGLVCSSRASDVACLAAPIRAFCLCVPDDA